VRTSSALLALVEPDNGAGPGVEVERGGVARELGGIVRTYLAPGDMQPQRSVGVWRRGLDPLCEIAHGVGKALRDEFDDAAIVVGRRIIRIGLDCLIVILDGAAFSPICKYALPRRLKA